MQRPRRCRCRYLVLHRRKVALAGAAVDRLHLQVVAAAEAVVVRRRKRSEVAKEVLAAGLLATHLEEVVEELEVVHRLPREEEGQVGLMRVAKAEELVDHR